MCAMVFLGDGMVDISAEHESLPQDVAERLEQQLVADLERRLPPLQQLVGCPERSAGLLPDVRKRLRREAHDLHGTGKAFGIPEVSTIGQQLQEDAARLDGSEASTRRVLSLIDELYAIALRYRSDRPH